MTKRFGLSIAAIALVAGALAAPTAFAEDRHITILNPRGAPPPIRLVPMAPRLDTLDGKTVYVVGISFMRPLIPELHKLLEERFPKTTWIWKDKGGSYFADAPDLWEEIRKNGDAAILGVGH